MSTTPITHDEVAVGDYVIIQNPHLRRFAVKVEKFGAERKYLVGRSFSIATFQREGLVAFSGTRRKVVSLRPTTSVQRIEVQS